MLACAQARDRLGVCAVAREVVAAEPLHRDDPAVREHRHRLLERHRQSWPAGGAGDRLGVEAAVERVLVLAAAVGTEREPGHRGVGPVVRNRADDREARPALRAVDERIPVAAIGRVEELAQAVVARRDVGRDQRRPSGSHAVDDPELGLADRGQRLGRHRLDPGERGRAFLQRDREAIELIAFDLDQHPVAVVQHVAAKAVLAGEAVDEGPEADALDDAPRPVPAPRDGRIWPVHHSSVVAAPLGDIGTGTEARAGKPQPRSGTVPMA